MAWSFINTGSFVSPTTRATRAHDYKLLKRETRRTQGDTLHSPNESAAGAMNSRVCCVYQAYNYLKRNVIVMADRALPE